VASIFFWEICGHIIYGPSELGFVSFFLMMLADWLHFQMPSLPHGAG
jgi:hypothetical protein